MGKLRDFENNEKAGIYECTHYVTSAMEDKIDMLWLEIVQWLYSNYYMLFQVSSVIDACLCLNVRQ